MGGGPRPPFTLTMTFRRYAPIGRTGGAAFDPTSDQSITGEWDFDGLNVDGAFAAPPTNGLYLSRTGVVNRIDSRTSGGPYGLGDLIIAADDITWAGTGIINFSSLGAATFGAGTSSTLTLSGSVVDLGSPTGGGTGDVRLNNGRSLLIRDSDESAEVDINHDGTDMNMVGASTTDLNIDNMDVRIEQDVFAANLPTYVVLSSDFTTTSTTAADVGLNFSPVASTKYLIEFYGMVETTVAGSAPQIGFSFPTGDTNSTGHAFWGTSVTPATEPQQVIFPDGGTSQMETTVTSLANIAMPVWGWALIDMGVTPVGDFSVQLEGEVATTATYTLRAGSMLRITVIG